MHEDLPDILKSHALDFRITKVHCDPSEEAYRSIKPERSARGRVLHLGQELATMTLEPQQVQVSIMVPKARISMGKNSEDSQAVFPIPDE